MASSSEKFNRNYQLDQIPNNSKKGYKNVYTYIGDYYTWDLKAVEIKNIRLTFFILEIATIIIFLYTSLQHGVLNSVPVVVIPALLSLIAWIFEIIAIFFFCFFKLPLKEEDHSRIHSTFFITFALRFILLFFSCIASIIVKFQLNLDAGELLTSFGYLICSGISAILWRRYKYIDLYKKIIMRN